MAQLNSSVVQGSLRVTDTTYTTDLNLASTTASRLLGTDTNKNVVSIDMTVAAPTAGSTTATAFITTVSQGADGKISASKANLPTASTSVTGIMKVGTGLSVSSGTVSVSYGSTANTAVQGNQTIFTLNGSAKNSGSSNTSFYAPTSSGATNQILVSGGTNAPVWTAAATLDSATSATSGTKAYTNLTLGNNVNVSAGTAHSEGKITLYSEATKAHIIQGQSTTDDFTHTLPNDTGILVSLNSGTAKGSTTKPVYVPNTGIITECSLYAGGTAVTLNVSNKSATTASFYAPTTYGTAGYILKANGESEAPFWVEKVSYNNLPTNDSFILTEGDNSANPPATAQATIPSNYALNRKIFYSQDTPSVTDADLGMFWFQPASFTMEDLKCLIVGVVATNTTSVTINNDDITTDMVVVKCVLSNPSAQTGDLTWTTTGKDPEDPNSHGNIVVNGTINGTTSMTFYLIHAR